MDISELEQKIQRAKDNDKYYNTLRNALLSGLSNNETTRDGKSQEEKMERVEKAIIENLQVKYDLEVLLARKKSERRN
jgi:hypothetical protein